jgi:regulatory protein YycI of two-component signal transduction system YycFG
VWQVDLSRAKTILIVAFLTLNLFLGYRLWFSPQLLLSGQAMTHEEVDRARELLNGAGFELTAAIPRQIPRLSLLDVGREDRNEAEWAMKFFEESLTGRRDEKGNIVFTKGNSRVTVAANGHVSYQGSAIPLTAGSEDTRQMVEAFMRERNLWRDDLKHDVTLPRDGQGTVRHRFVQTYQGFPLFFCLAEAAVTDNRITELEIYRVVPRGFSGKEIQVISALEAIEMFLEQKVSFSDQRIADISLGYFSADYDAQRWEIVPVWRIADSAGNAVYINAFTGEVETAGS